MKRSIACAATLAALFAAPAQAQVEQVTVTGTRLPAPVGQAAFSAVTLDADALAVSGRLDDALKQVPGLSLFRRSGSINANATTQGVSLRSIAPSGAGRALVLLDGVPVNDPFGGWVLWTALPYEDLESADVVRGAGSGPYGAGALTGTISLTESSATTADLSAGGLGTYRGGIAGGARIGAVDFFAHASAQRTDGWIPVHAVQRGAADNHLWFGGASGSLRAQTTVNDVLVSLRVGGYREARGAGLVGADSRAEGLTESLTVARAVTSDHLGWRAQLWSMQTGFTNTSVSVAPGRVSATPANDQYATPALGWGGSAALLGEYGLIRWEAGGDLRVNSGESREFFTFSGGDFLNNRRAGGKLTVAGVYGEAAFDTSQWLFTLGARADYWSTAQGHLVQSVRATGAVTLASDYAGRDGIVPTGRLGARHNFDDGQYLRAAAYAGFRPPSLNELYRPFRVGNDQTQANPSLTPEKLYGAEIGWGYTDEMFTANVTAWWNRLNGAIVNATCAAAPPAPCIGTAPGGVLRQRQNAGDIAALGLEGDASAKLSEKLFLHGAFSITDARLEDSVDPTHLNGKRPAQAPRITVTGGASWTPLENVTLDAALRWESRRFEDDLNSLVLKSALELDLRATWAFAQSWSAYLAADNAADADIATGNAAGILSYASPRVVSVGLTYRP